MSRLDNYYPAESHQEQELSELVYVLHTADSGYGGFRYQPEPVTGFAVPLTLSVNISIPMFHSMQVEIYSATHNSRGLCLQ